MTLGQIVADAMQMAQEMRVAGVEESVILNGLERTLRDHWPLRREWKTLCQRCDDYGLEMAACPGDASCGRERVHLPHDFGRPCWCDKGSRFREKKADDDLGQAGKTQKSRGFSRLGR